MVGKRKRETRVVARSEEASILDAAQIEERDVIRQYFESQFEPLEEASTNVKKSLKSGNTLDGQSDDLSLSDWEGFSGEESTSLIEIIDHGEKDKESTHLMDDVWDAKLFMGTKPPVLDESRLIKNQKPDEQSHEERAAEAINLKHDLELQRLLKESHLLDRSTGTTLTHNHRHKVVDLRMQSLGAKTSLFKQAKMPLSHYRGIMAKASQKEASRRKEAKENGIILEKETKGSSAKNVRRERGVGAPTIGNFQGGTLNLSRKDINNIQGQKKGHQVPQKRRR